MTINKLTLSRLQKQQKNIQQQPIPNVLVSRKGVLNFHFCIYGLENQYQNGYYHGILQLSQQYPFKPPRLIFITPSGRFQTHKSICTTFTNFHKQAWTSSWTIRSMLLALVQFMLSNQKGLGSLSQSSTVRRKLAKQSLEWNLKFQEFRELFKHKINNQKKGNKSTNSANQGKNIKSISLNTQNNSININYLYVLLIIVIGLWISMKF